MRLRFDRLGLRNLIRKLSTTRRKVRQRPLWLALAAAAMVLPPVLNDAQAQRLPAGGFSRGGPGMGRGGYGWGRGYPGRWHGPAGGLVGVGPGAVVVVDDGDGPAPRHAKTRRHGLDRHARDGFAVPPPGERRYVRDEVLLQVAADVSTRTLEGLGRRHRLTRLESHRFALTGRTFYRWRIDDGRSVPAVIRALADDVRIVSAQPNYLFMLEDQPDPGPAEGDPAQYAVAKLHLAEAHRLATGDKVLVAVIDSGIDASHPDLAGAIAEKFDALGGESKPHAHGTGIAGAIAAHGKLVGAAPHARLLAVRAFDGSETSAEGTTFNILKGLDWAAAHGARVVNMSFAGPPDPALADALAKAHGKQILLVAAAGNGGPKSPPLYPAADPNVVAVTATDAADKLFREASRGAYVALAAPGVDVLTLAPQTGVQLTSGTSVASAEVSGIAALLIEAKPSLAPDEIRKVLESTARGLGKSRGEDYGAGLADALRAVTAVRPEATAKATDADAPADTGR